MIKEIVFVTGIHPYIYFSSNNFDLHLQLIGLISTFHLISLTQVKIHKSFDKSLVFTSPTHPIPTVEHFNRS